MCHYRKGELTPAREALAHAAAADQPRLRLLSLAFLAMTRFQQGEIEEATDHLHAVEDGLGLVAFTDLSRPAGIHHDDLAIWLALREVRQVMQVEPVDTQHAVDRLLQWKRKVVETSPTNTAGSLHLAILYAWFGSNRQHSDLCQRMLDEALQSEQPAALERAAKAYLIHPAPKSDLLDAVAVSATMAVQGARKKPGLLSWARLTAGMAAFRQKEYPKAIDLLTITRESSSRLIQGPSLLFRCMAYLKQGQRKLAEKDFALATGLFGPRPAKTALTEVLLHHDQLVFWLAYDEARERLAESPSENQDAHLSGQQ